MGTPSSSSSNCGNGECDFPWRGRGHICHHLLPSLVILVELELPPRHDARGRGHICHHLLPSLVILVELELPPRLAREHARGWQIDSIEEGGRLFLHLGFSDHV